MEFGFWSLLPPLAAIILALLFKNVFVALFTGVFLGYLTLVGGNFIPALDQTLMSFIKVFESNGNTIIVFGTAMLGGLVYVLEQSGGINGFVEYMTAKRALIRNKKGANLFTFFLGVVVFTSGTLSTLVTGTVARPLSDAMGVPHEKLSYIVHSTSSPVCALLPLSGWGAYMIGLIQAQGIENPASVVAKSIPLNFYCILAVFGVLFFVLTEKDFGPMKKAEERATKTGLLNALKGNEAQAEAAVTVENKIEKKSSALNLILPLVVLVVVIIAVMLITGKGNLLKGDGTKGIYWGIVLGFVTAGILYISQKLYSFEEFLNVSFKGIGNMFSIAIILVFAFSMGSVVKELGTGQYLAGLFSSILTPALLPALVFVISCLISFATGTSFGTMAVMMPIALPMALIMGNNIPLVASAVIGGSVFGDHASPISDTTIMSCASTGANVIDHIKSQLPYALLWAGITIILYVIAGFVL